MRWRRVAVSLAAVTGLASSALGVVPAAAADAALARSRPRVVHATTKPVRVTQAAATPGDGTTSATAGASCWGIKRLVPAATDGLYWLLTPQLVAPGKFWCDMTTDGGGWVLIGRGRQGWAWRDRGQGGAANVAATPGGPAAFAVQYYPSSTVDALLGGARPDALVDGVRVRRAGNVTGTAWQEVRYRLGAVPRWSWAFGGSLPLVSVTVAGRTFAAHSTVDTFPATRNDGYRVYTYDWSLMRKTYSAGFGYGFGVVGASDAPTAYLWQSTRHEGAPEPFAQVYVRPHLASSAAAGAPIPDAGLPAVTVPHLLSSTSEPLTGWGVTGYDPATSPATGWKSDAIALAQVGERIYVGGMFQDVRRGSNGAPNAQRYLAAFDRLTGAFIPSFAPVLDGGVWALAVTAQGTLVVGGRFTTVNGVRHAGLVALDPVTGATRTGWQVTPAVSVRTQVSAVRSLAVQGNWVYIGGTMTAITGGAGVLARHIIVSHLARVDAITGRPDAAFRPVLSGQPWSITTSALGDRVYLAGSFTRVNGAASNGAAVVDTVTGRTVPGLQPVVPSYQCPAPCAVPGYHPYAQAMVESADGKRVFAAPTEHTLQLLDRATLTRRYSHITAPGGDVQSIVESDGVVYAACHCFNYDYSGASRYPGTAGDRVSSIYGIGAYDSTSLAKLDDFEPFWKGRYNDGLWVSLLDSAGCIWFAGDVGGASQGRWAGGFVKFCPRDAAAPLAPESLTVDRSVDAGGRLGALLTWAGGGDASGAVTFQVMRGDRVVAVTNAHTWSDDDAPAGARYVVRAVDATGNVSASTPVRVLPG